MSFLSDNEIEKMSYTERRKYYSQLKDYCLQLKDNQLHFGQKLIHHVYPILRNYNIEIEGEENIPKDTNAIFVVNHSNSHDIFTMYEVLSMLGRKGSVMVATDCLNPITTGIFNISNATLLSRTKETERKSSVFYMTHKVLLGYDSVIFGESTWNLHPIKPMHNIKKGPIKIQAPTQVPIIPTIMEYIEETDMVKKEKDLYKKCVIRFGKPMMANYEDSMIYQAQSITEKMANMRKDIWNNYNIKRDKLSDIDPKIYVNHTYLKKFGAFGFIYDSKKEQEYLLFLDREPKENEYCINTLGEFVPGITEREKKLRKLLQK